MKQNVLFIAPTWCALHEDVIKALVAMGYYVDFLADSEYRFDPNSRRTSIRNLRFFDNIYKIQYWNRVFNKQEYSKVYDLLFVIDGMSLHPHLFDILQKRNPKIRKVNYLFDTNSGVYDFYRHFNYFDKVFTFDPEEAELYKIELLPIYWTDEMTNSIKEEYKCDIFGFGAYNAPRYKLFKKVSELANLIDKTTFIKLYYGKINNKTSFLIKSKIRRLFKRHMPIPYNIYNSSIVTNTLIPQEEYRSIIMHSKVVVDSAPNYQKGLTARMMWCLGLEAKVLTTNAAITNYLFYNPDQVYILDEVEDLKQEDLKTFVEKQFNQTEIIRAELLKYRIDNWIAYIINSIERK